MKTHTERTMYSATIPLLPFFDHFCRFVSRLCIIHLHHTPYTLYTIRISERVAVLLRFAVQSNANRKIANVCLIVHTNYTKKGAFCAQLYTTYNDKHNCLL